MHTKPNSIPGILGILCGVLCAFLGCLIDLVLPVRCVGCGLRGAGCCMRCVTAFDGPFPVCRPVLANGPPAYALADYRGAARAAVIGYKERGRRDLAGVLGRVMAAVLPWLPGAAPDSDGTWWLVPAPSRAVAARRRGGWHLARLAREVAAALSSGGRPVVVAPALRMAPQVSDSVGLGAAARVANLAGRVRLWPAGAPPAGTPVVLLDDVLASGATAAACVRELGRGGIPVSAVLALTAVCGP